jgi:hypothetical protein
MNEQIQQLALDAGIGFTLWDDSGRAMIDNYTPEERLAEFAELIVAECMQIIKVDMYEDAISNMWSKNKLQMIKEHFGVDK